ncbi:MAG: tryptophan-rich sensory protein [Candidatus Pacebacteria bacterium]|nr:tryptophan-rich sensory protein [Candidatus Paceibacterota bacterium]
MSNSYTWYSTLLKPSWAPPSFLFGPVWTVLYILIAYSFGTVLYKAYIQKLPWIVAVPFILNLAFNIAFTYLQFGLKNNILATIDIVLVLGTLMWALVAIWPHFRWIVYINLPYLLWVSFATVLQITITFLNR